MILRQLLESKIKYSNESMDGPSSQYNGLIKATEDKKVIGTLEYTEYNGFVTISMVEVDKKYRGNKIGFNLIKELAKLYPYTRIKRENLTADGEKLYKSTEKYFAPYIKKGVDEWGKSLLFKKYLEYDISNYSKKELLEILNSWNNEMIEIDDLDFFENINSIRDWLNENKVQYKENSNTVKIKVNDKLLYNSVKYVSETLVLNFSNFAITAHTFW